MPHLVRRCRWLAVAGVVAGPVLVLVALACSRTGRSVETGPAVAAPAAFSPAVDFATEVRPILERNCRPCHFDGGVMHERLPFDRAETIRHLGDKLFTRIDEPEEQATIRAFLEAGNE